MLLETPNSFMKKYYHQQEGHITIPASKFHTDQLGIMFLSASDSHVFFRA